jgi:hypothetical protein
MSVFGSRMAADRDRDRVGAEDRPKAQWEPSEESAQHAAANALESKLHRASSREVAVAQRLVPPSQSAHAGDKYGEPDALQA